MKTRNSIGSQKKMLPKEETRDRQNKKYILNRLKPLKVEIRSQKQEWSKGKHKPG